MTNNKVKQICSEIFDDYDILNATLDGKDVVLKMKPKKLRKSFSKVVDSALEPIPKLNFG